MKVFYTIYVFLLYLLLTSGREEKKSDHRLIYESEDIIRQQDAEEGKNLTQLKTGIAHTAAGVDRENEVLTENAIEYLPEDGNVPKYNDVNNERPIIPETVKVVEGIPELCTLPKRTGKCRGHMPRFFFNIDTKTCERFIYGGCDGNENRFLTVDECHHVCYLPSSL